MSWDICVVVSITERVKVKLNPLYGIVICGNTQKLNKNLQQTYRRSLAEHDKIQ